MPQYEEENKTIEVPPGTGVPGFLEMIKRLLELPRLQQLVVLKDKVSYKRFKLQGEEEQAVDADLTTLMPSSVIRNGVVSEIKPMSDIAAIVVAQLFAQVHMEGLSPIAFVSGKNSKFREWHAQTTGVILSTDDVYGLPLLLDNNIPDEALILCAAYLRRAYMVDVVRSYKVTIPLLRTR